MFAVWKGLNAPELQGFWGERHSFTSDIGHRYPTNVIVNDDITAIMDSRAVFLLTLGKRLLSMTLYPTCQ